MKRRLSALLLALVLLCALPLTALAADMPADAAQLTVDHFASNEAGWYRFEPTEDAIYAIYPEADHFKITVYQTRLSPAEIAEAEQTLQEYYAELDAGRAAIAPGQAQYDAALAEVREPLSHLDEYKQKLEEMRPTYDYYVQLLTNPLFSSQAARDFVKQFADLEYQITELEDAAKQLNDAKTALDDGYRQLAEAEAQVRELEELVQASRAGRSGPALERNSVYDEPVMAMMDAGSEFYLHLELEGVNSLFCEKLSNTFVDVPMDAYYFDPVYWAALNGITNGVDATHFAPEQTCTRAQIVTFLWRAVGSPEHTGQNPFADVPGGEYHTDAVLWAVENRITNGVDATHFAPDDPCTRAQIVTFLWRAAGSPTKIVQNPFLDVTAGEYYSEAVLWAISYAITNGVDPQHFAPESPCTRAQVVTFLYRAMF